MYWLVLDLPFDVSLVWSTTFNSLSEAEEEMNSLPFGFQVVDYEPDGILVPFSQGKPLT